MKHASPTPRERFISELTRLVKALNCRGTPEGFPPMPKAEHNLELDKILWMQIMMGDKAGMEMSLKLGADPNTRVHRKTLLQLAKAFKHQYGVDMVDMLIEYGAKLTPSHKKGPKKTAL